MTDTRSRMAKIINRRIHKNSDVNPETIMPGTTCVDCTSDLMAAGVGSKHETAMEVIKILQAHQDTEFLMDATAIRLIRDAFPEAAVDAQ